MSPCPVITLSDISTEKYEALIAAAQAQGLALAGKSGNASHRGMEFTWNYDSDAQVLTIQCIDKPMLIPCAMIEAQLRGLVG
jgi:hypothetical protein